MSKFPKKLFKDGDYDARDPRVMRVVLHYERLTEELIGPPDDETKAKWEALSQEEKLK